MKKVLSFIWKLVRSHLLLKIMSLLFAVILWSYVLAETNPARERVITDIKVRYDNVADLKDKGLDISASLSEILDTVDIRLEVKQSELKFVSDETVRAIVDLSTINGTGPYSLKIRAETNYGRWIEVSPSVVTLYIDDYVSQTVPVNVEVVGAVPAGYHAEEPEISPNVITVSGARVDVEKVASAACTLDLTGLTEGYKKSVEIELLDSEGNPVNKTLFAEAFPSVIVELDIHRKKTVPIDAAGSIFGQDEIAPGFEIVDITSTPSEVSIAGDAAVLADISSISLVPYNVSGADTSVVVLLDYQLPEGVLLLTSEKAQVFVNIRETVDTHEFSNIELGLKNLQSGYNARLESRTIDVTVLASLSRLSALNRSDIVPYVDLEGLGPGTYTRDVQFVLPSGFTAENFSPSVSTMTVTIY